MGGSIIRVLQIGDVHFPKASVTQPAADIKRDALGVGSQIAPEGARFQKMTQYLASFDEDYIDAIAFMGDFTTGDRDLAKQMDGLEACISYFDINIVRPLMGSRAFSNVLFVPGNHDVDRTKCPTVGDRLVKFQQYKAALAARGQSHISLSDVSRVDVASDGNQMALYGLNTCLACGEFMSFPPSVAAKLAERLAEVLLADAGDDATQLIAEYLDLTEQVDAPMIDDATLDALDNELESYQRRHPQGVPVVVGHHNLLPQIVPRVAPFSELVNSGKLRSRLSARNYPICYLHGHIHDSPIEVIFNQDHPDGCVISISAPQYIDGVNIIEFHFDESGEPLGLVVAPIKQDELATITRSPPRRISFRQGRHRVAAISPLARSIFYETFAKSTILHFNELLKAHATDTPEAVENAVLELEWLELVQIHNRDRNPRKWNIGSAL